MPAIAANNVTIQVLRRVQYPGLGQKRNHIRIGFGDTILTYPAGGVPLPGYVNFGFLQGLTGLYLYDSSDVDGTYFKYDAETQKIRMYLTTQQTGTPGNRAGAEFTTADTPAFLSMYAEVVGY